MEGNRIVHSNPVAIPDAPAPDEIVAVSVCCRGQLA
jgi:hypothetical protein